jgi:glycosyltransferase involved in cell wall biosynthesis
MVSIIIPCFNAQKYIAKAIESVFSQLYKDWEIILVDNNSTDGTYAVLEQFAANFPELISVYSENRKGSNYARNLGLNYAKGDYIQFLDADDEIMSSKLQDQLAKMEQAGAQVILGSFVKKNDNYSLDVVVNEKKNFWKSYAASCLGITSANLYEKSALLAVNGWSVQLSSSQEYDLLLRLIQSGAVVELDEQLSTIVYEVPNSITRGSSPERTIEVINDYINLRMSLKAYLKKELLLTAELNSFIDQCIYRVLIGRRRHHPVYVEERIKSLKLDVPLSYKVKVRANAFAKKLLKNN